MRDPRLVEIDLLMDVERSGSLKIRSTMQGATSGAGHRHRNLYGVDASTFRDLVLDTVRRGYLVGFTAHGDTIGITEAILEHERRKLMETLISGQEIDVLLSHPGRVRMWDLRDQLLRDPDIEPMGLRSKAAWERDLPLRLLWAQPEAPLGVLFVDLDDFGRVNKTFGSRIGDEVLKATFSLMKNLVGARGAVYRFGGEEVGILLPGMAASEVAAVAEQVRGVIAADVVLAVPMLGQPQTASIGAATFEMPCGADEALERVDARMREAKNAGKNRVVSC